MNEPSLSMNEPSFLRTMAVSLGILVSQWLWLFLDLVGQVGDLDLWTRKGLKFVLTCCRLENRWDLDLRLNCRNRWTLTFWETDFPLDPEAVKLIFAEGTTATKITVSQHETSRR